MKWWWWNVQWRENPVQKTLEWGYDDEVALWDLEMRRLYDFDPIISSPFHYASRHYSRHGETSTYKLQIYYQQWYYYSYLVITTYTLLLCMHIHESKVRIGISLIFWRRPIFLELFRIYILFVQIMATISLHELLSVIFFRNRHRRAYVFLFGKHLTSNISLSAYSLRNLSQLSYHIQREIWSILRYVANIQVKEEYVRSLQCQILMPFGYVVELLKCRERGGGIGTKFNMRYARYTPLKWTSSAKLAVLIVNLSLKYHLVWIFIICTHSWFQIVTIEYDKATTWNQECAQFMKFQT